jgi:hypothetical protein
MFSGSVADLQFSFISFAVTESRAPMQGMSLILIDGTQFITAMDLRRLLIRRFSKKPGLYLLGFTL